MSGLFAEPLRIQVVGRETRTRQRCSVNATGCVDLAAEPRLLPPLEEMSSAEPSGTDGHVVMPCFPLPLELAALPGTERTLNIREPRYIQMYDDMIRGGQQEFAVPRIRRGPSGPRLTETCVVYHLKDLRDAPVGARFRYVCKHYVSRRVRICRVLNPGVFADQSAYLRVECQHLGDTDAESTWKREESSLHDTLEEVVELHRKSGVSMRRYEYHTDASGRMKLVDYNTLPSISSETLMQADAARSGFWHLANLWQGYCQRRIVAMRQRRDRDALAMARDSSWTAAKAQAARRAADTEMASVEEDTSKLMQQLIQADSHSTRLALLHQAALGEVDRLAAAAALRSVVGGEY